MLQFVESFNAFLLVIKKIMRCHLPHIYKKKHDFNCNVLSKDSANFTLKQDWNDQSQKAAQVKKIEKKEN